MSCRCGRDTDVHLCHAGGYTCHHAGRRYDSTLHGRPYTTWVCAAHLASYQQIERQRNGDAR